MREEGGSEEEGEREESSFGVRTRSFGNVRLGRERDEEEEVEEGDEEEKSIRLDGFGGGRGFDVEGEREEEGEGAGEGEEEREKEVWQHSPRLLPHPHLPPPPLFLQRS